MHHCAAAVTLRYPHGGGGKIAFVFPIREGVCALLGLLTGFLSHYALLAPLATLAPQSRRIETSLTTACLAFWQVEA